MKNWSGYLQWQPTQVFYPESEATIAQIVKDAAVSGRRIRVMGSAHSFTPLCPTHDTTVSLSRYQGIISVDVSAQLATVRAGTPLRQLSELLDAHGLALENLGDIDTQSIAGAIATGTHGAGTAFGNLCTQVRALKFVNGQGELVSCSLDQNPELFRAVVLSLGALGIITEVTLKCVPAYNLSLRIARQHLDEVLENLPRYNAENRHFEFYWFPHTPYVMTKSVNLTNAPPDPRALKNYLQEMVFENYAFLALCELAYRLPGLARPISRFAAATIGPYHKQKKSYEVFSTARLVRFNEMEYNVPADAYVEVKKELVNWINRRNYQVMFPLENRFVRADDLYLSPAFGRDSAYIAAHVYHKQYFHKYFDELEIIFLAHGGRPHWGKMHNLSHTDFAALYPGWQTFHAHRAQQDPQGLFLNPHLEYIFGPNTLNTPAAP
jgi:FAD-linked oxidoreductase